MPRHHFPLPQGEVRYTTIRSKALAGNLTGDPTERSVGVYLPQGYDQSQQHYPLFVCLAGYTGSGLKHLGWQSFGPNLPQRLDRLIAEGKMGPVVVAFPDAFTSLGGNQYIDSIAMGNWEAFVLDEMIPALEREFRIHPQPETRAVFGKSSGGYGALIHGMRHGDRWGAVACHSGDMGFEIVYGREWPSILMALAPYGGEPSRFIEAVSASPKIRGSQFHTLMMLAMAATYDPDPNAPFGVRLPVDGETCERIPERWENWLRHDPLTLVEWPECQAKMRRLKTLFIDCGSRDQYHLQFPARTLRRRLDGLQIAHVYEEFDDDHSSIDYRMDRSLPLLFEAVSRL